jgi:hypothetical protein
MGPDVTADYGGTQAVLGGHTASESNLNAASEGYHLIAQLQVIMSDLQTSGGPGPCQLVGPRRHPPDDRVSP